MLENQQVIAIDQDRLGVQGTAIAEEGSGQVWVRPLSHGARAVALLNTGTTAIDITTTAGAVGLTHVDRYRLANLWSGRSRNTTGKITVRVPANAAVLYRATPNPTALAADGANRTRAR